MKNIVIVCGLTLGLATLGATLASECRAGDQRRVQHATVACTDTGTLKKALNGSRPAKKKGDEACIGLREGDVVIVERESPPYAHVRPGGKVDLYWMPLEHVQWKKP